MVGPEGGGEHEAGPKVFEECRDGQDVSKGGREGRKVKVHNSKEGRVWE